MPNYARTGGILNIISGAFSIFGGVSFGALYIVMGLFMAQNTKDQASSQMGGLIFTIMGIIFGLFFILVGILAIVGGVYTLKRKNWALAIAGAVAAALVFFPLGIAGTILVSLGKPEFSSGKTALPAEQVQDVQTTISQAPDDAK